MCRFPVPVSRRHLTHKDLAEEGESHQLHLPNDLHLLSGSGTALGKESGLSKLFHGRIFPIRKLHFDEVIIVDAFLESCLIQFDVLVRRFHKGFGKRIHIVRATSVTGTTVAAGGRQRGLRWWCGRCVGVGIITGDVVAPADRMRRGGGRSWLAVIELTLRLLCWLS